MVQDFLALQYTVSSRSQGIYNPIVISGLVGEFTQFKMDISRHHRTHFYSDTALFSMQLLRIYYKVVLQFSGPGLK